MSERVTDIGLGQCRTKGFLRGKGVVLRHGTTKRVRRLLVRQWIGLFVAQERQKAEHQYACLDLNLEV